ncbi:hypothetical protein LZ32DRAFT_221494 [Colletotrichum eremochloae]|nr:hypothetical protein LZ32DRAFT_221494 [Colletotrichum eremochloae]
MAAPPAENNSALLRSKFGLCTTEHPEVIWTSDKILRVRTLAQPPLGMLREPSLLRKASVDAGPLRVNHLSRHCGLFVRILWHRGQEVCVHVPTLCKVGGRIVDAADTTSYSSSSPSNRLEAAESRLSCPSTSRSRGHSGAPGLETDVSFSSGLCSLDWRLYEPFPVGVSPGADGSPSASP